MKKLICAISEVKTIYVDQSGLLIVELIDGNEVKLLLDNVIYFENGSLYELDQN